MHTSYIYIANNLKTNLNENWTILSSDYVRSLSFGICGLLYFQC